MEMDPLRQLISALVGRDEVCCARCSCGGQWIIKWGRDEREARERSPQTGRRRRIGKVAVRMETGRKVKGRKEMGGTKTAGKATERRRRERRDGKKGDGRD